MKAIYQNFIGTTAEWESENPVLYNAVFGIETAGDGKRLFKVGDGVHDWQSLPYVNPGNIEGLPEILEGLVMADALLAPLESPAFTGEPTVPEPDAASNDGRAASTKWTKDRIDEAISGGLPVPFSVEQGGTGASTAGEARDNLGVTAAIAAEAEEREDADTTETQARQAADTAEADARAEADADLNIRVQAVGGRGGYLAAHDFGAADLSDTAGQEALNDYAVAQIGGITDPTEIWNGTHVKNLYVDPATVDPDHPDGVPDGNVWALTNTPDTDPPIFEWSNDGPEMVGQATNNRLGVVKGTADPGDGSADGMVTVLPDGTEKVVGWERRQPPGMIVHSAMNAASLARYRLRPLDGGIIDVSEASVYYELGDAVYVGDDLNPTAEAFYKCDAGGARTTSGTYLKLPDARGIFMRGAGSQSRANVSPLTGNTTFDGGAIGKYTADRIRNATGHFASGTSIGIVETSGIVTVSTAGQPIGVAVTSLVSNYNRVNVNLANQVPTGADNAPASISAQICITY